MRRRFFVCLQPATPLKVKPAVRSGPKVALVHMALILSSLLMALGMDGEEILSTFSLWPQHFTTDHYRTIFTDVSWYSGYINSLIYVAINTVISLAVALPAAYAFSRYSFLGDQQLFFWLLTNRMTPPAVFLLPFFQLYTTLGLMDTHIAVALAHCIFNVPLAVWILEGFVSSVPREIDETAYIDGYSFPRFFLTIFLPLIKAGVGVAAFFCFMFSWVELLLARTLTSVNAKPIVATMTRTVSASGMDWGVLAAAGVRIAGFDRDEKKLQALKSNLGDACLARVVDVAAIEVDAQDGRITAFPKPGKQIFAAVNEVLKERNVAVREIALEGGRLDEVFRSITQAAPAKEVRP